MIKKSIIAAVMTVATLGAAAQQGHDTMYLVKGDRVVGKYNVEDVDYATFSLPEGVADDNIWLGVDKVGKNTVTYTVNTVNDFTAYAHNILSYYEVNYMAMDAAGESWESLGDEDKNYILQYTLSYNAYVGAGTKSYTQTDWMLDNTGDDSRFNVTPGTRYFLCAWEIDPVSGAPLDTFVWEEIKTEDPAASPAALDLSFLRFNEEGAAFSITAGSEMSYVVTCWGFKDGMKFYEEVYGLDFLLGTFGQRWAVDFLQGDGDLRPGIENATWPTDGPGEYILYVRGYDMNGDVVDKEITVVYEEEKVGGPEITIFSKEKSDGHVKINFEIAPSNVEEAYVRMLDENTVDDRLNMGYELHEIAMGGDAADITSAINTTGEYTFESNDVPESWQSILIYAKDKDGKRTTLRINFNTLDQSEWSIYNPVFAAPARKLQVKTIRNKRNPSIRKN